METPESKAVNRLLDMLDQERRARKIAENTLTELQKQIISEDWKIRALPVWRRKLLSFLKPA